MLIKRSIAFLFVVIVLSLAGCTGLNGSKEEATSKDTPMKLDASIGDVEEGIRSYIRAQTEKGGGTFTFRADSAELSLRLVRVHTEYLSVLGSGRYFACVDLADTSGDVYDVDFFLDGKPGDMNVTETTLHKLNGKPFYTWKQRNDKTWYKREVEGASNDLLGVIEGTDHFIFHYKGQLPKIDGDAEMWIPLAQTDRAQTIKVIEQDVPGDTLSITDATLGNTILYCMLGPEHSNQPFSISYEVRRSESAAYEDTSSDPTDFLGPAPLLPTGGRFSAIVRTVLEGKEDEGDLVKARALYDFIIDTVRYAKQGKYGTGDANYACDSRSGNCTEFHSYFISLARTARIPARFAIGAAIPSERNEGGVNGYHCWAEFYAEGKWWPVDISEGNKYTALATYYFGHHPANRIELSRGRDLQVTPSPASGNIPFIAYPLLEVEGKGMPVSTKFSFVREEERKKT